VLLCLTIKILRSTNKVNFLFYWDIGTNRLYACTRLLTGPYNWNRPVIYRSLQLEQACYISVLTIGTGLLYIGPYNWNRPIIYRSLQLEQACYISVLTIGTGLLDIGP
jgi:hypothetical protein